MMKVVINKCYGGFGLSHKAIMYYASLCGFDLYPFVGVRNTDGSLDFERYKPYEGEDNTFLIHYSKSPLNADGRYEEDSCFSAGRNMDRSDPNLIEVVKDLGQAANGDYAQLEIVDIPDDVDYVIEEYDGIEWVAEKHRTWS